MLGYVSDVDGSVVKNWTTELLPGVALKVVSLQEEEAKGEVRIGFATNQAGPGWRELLGNAKYADVEKLAANLLTIAQALQCQRNVWMVSLWDDRFLSLGKSEEEVNQVMADLKQRMVQALQDSMPNLFVFTEPPYRKPKPGMLLRAMNLWGLQPAQMRYIGDREEDEQAADAARFLYIPAATFFSSGS